MKNYNSNPSYRSDYLIINSLTIIYPSVSKIRHDDKYLEFPSGKIETGETPQGALKRELLEEMNYMIEVGPKIITVNHAYPDFGITMTAFLCTADSPTFVINEHVAYEWRKVENLKELDWDAADVGMVEAIVDLRSNI